MPGKRRRIFIELLLLVVITITAGWYGWHYVSSIDDAGLLRNTKMLPIPVLSGAVHFALGRGVGVTHEKESGFPELEAFLNAELSAIPRDAWPEPGVHAKASGHFFYMHYHLIAYLGSLFYLLGISVWTFRIACVLLHVLSMLALYGLFRQILGRLFSFVPVLFLSTSHAYLVMLPTLRDLSKAPFILAALLLMVIIAKRPHSPRRLCLWSLLLGIVIGFGYGFRQDVFICLPLALFIIVAASRPTCNHPWRVRLITCLVLAGMFVTAALPVFKGDREVGGTITIHTLFQGLMRCAEDNARFYSNSYDFGYLNYDHPVTAQIRAYAKRTGDIYPVHDLTPAYGDVGGRMFREFAQSYPADLAGRVIAVLDSLPGIPAHSFQTSDTHAKNVLEGRIYGGRFMRTVQVSVGRFFDAYGLLIILAGLTFLAARSYTGALLTAIFLGYFCAYPSTLFEYRHYFYLAFVPLFFTGIVATYLYESGAAFIRRLNADSWKTLLQARLGAAGKGILFTTIFVLSSILVLAGLREFQKRQWSPSLDRYANASLSRLPLEEKQAGDNVQLLLPKSMVELQQEPSPQPGEVASFYLAARFRHDGRTISFRLLNTNPTFERPCQVTVQGSGLYFFPVYDYDFDPPFRFLGIEINAGDRSCFDGLYLFETGDALRFWPYIFVPENRDNFACYKTGRLDRWAKGMVAEASGGYGIWPEKSLTACLNLIVRHPHHTAFADRALMHAQRCADIACRIKAWETIGAFMPERRLEAAAWLVNRAEEVRKTSNLSEAILLYQKAVRIFPSNLRYQEIIAELQETRGAYAAALTTYETLLERQPENASVAHRLQGLYSAQEHYDEALSYWKRLSASSPHASVPLLYYGITLEAQGDIQGAVEAYAKIPEEAPVYPESTFRRGALLAGNGAYEQGLKLLSTLQEDRPEYEGRVSNILIELPLKLKERKEYNSAARFYEVLAELRPDSPDLQEKLAELYELKGDTDKALYLYENLLEQKPDWDTLAKRLDLLYAAEFSENFTRPDKQNGERAITFWSTLTGRHPEKALPRLYLGTALERADDLSKARRAYQKALEIQPDYADALYRLGALDVLEGALDTGILKVREAAGINPTLSGDISRRCDRLAEQLIDQQRYDEAMTAYETALTLSPQDLWPRVHQGMLYEILGNDESAAECYRAVLTAVPNSPVTAKRLGDLLQRQPAGKEAAVTEWRKITQQHPDAAVPALHLGNALENAGNVTEAITAYKKALQLDPALADAKTGLDRLIRKNTAQ